MSTSLPPTQPHRTSPVQTILPMARVDACPNACGNTEAPFWVTPTAEHWAAYIAHYQCSDCGHRWTTSWVA